MRRKNICFWVVYGSPILKLRSVFGLLVQLPTRLLFSKFSLFFHYFTPLKMSVYCILFYFSGFLCSASDMTSIFPCFSFNLHYNLFSLSFFQRSESCYHAVREDPDKLTNSGRSYHLFTLIPENQNDISCTSAMIYCVTGHRVLCRCVSDLPFSYATPRSVP